ncbi:MAG: hypothetical protein AAF414_16305 [Pseudomonadota bacterium]
MANLWGGERGGIAHYLGWDRSATWIITLILFILIIVAAGYAVAKRWDGVFIDERNRISLSRFQIVSWTLLLVSALFSSGLSNFALNEPNPLEIQIPPEIWALLGIGSFSLVGAPMILRQHSLRPQPNRLATIKKFLKDGDGLKDDVDNRGLVVVKETPEDARWLDLIRGDTGNADRVDVSKVQMLFFTGILIVIYGSGLFEIFGHDGPFPLPVDKFPDVDAGFVALLGLSHAAYLSYKAAITD